MGFDDVRAGPYGAYEKTFYVSLKSEIQGENNIIVST